jgi:hypothetical protein
LGIATGCRREVDDLRGSLRATGALSENAPEPAGFDALGAELARFLANLHAPQILALARDRLDDPLRIPEPGLQATTDELRLRFTPMIEARDRARVRRWCDCARP